MVILDQLFSLLLFWQTPYSINQSFSSPEDFNETFQFGSF